MTLYASYSKTDFIFYALEYKELVVILNRQNNSAESKPSRAGVSNESHDSPKHHVRFREINADL